MDLAIFSTRIFTGDADIPWAEAVGIKDNKIAALGSNQEVKKLINAGTREIDMPGRLVTPGLMDGHAHFTFLGRTITLVGLNHAKSLEECLERVRQAAENCPPGVWIVGRGWNHHQWDIKREPTMYDLDKVTPENPAIMIRADGHSSWVNSLAMKISGVTADSNDPPGGRIERDEAGNPTGLFREAASRLVQGNMPSLSHEDWKENALTAQKQSLAFGLTGIHSIEGISQMEAIWELDKEDKIKLRLPLVPVFREMKQITAKGLRPGEGSSRVWYSQMKMFADGTLGSGTALLHEPYTDNPETNGIAVISPERLENEIAIAYEAGWSVCIHAIGDKAVSTCLEAIKGARTRMNIKPGTKRDRLEHVQLVRPQDLALFRELGVVASVQPVFLPTDWKIAEKLWGAERCQYAYAWNTFIKKGIPLQFGSDAPFDIIKPILGLQAAVSRQGPPGEPPDGWFPEEKLSLENSIRAFTALPAWTAYRENELGSITVGKWADMTIFERDLFEVEPESWGEVDVEMTIIDGQVEFEKTG